MNRRSFVDAVRSYGVPLAYDFHSAGRSRAGLRALMSFDTQMVGSTGHRWYTGRHVRRMVGWLMLNKYLGDADKGVRPEQRYRAVRLMAAATEGWVVLADGEVLWSLVPPVHTLRSQCAAAIRVPDWRH